MKHKIVMANEPKMSQPPSMGNQISMGGTFKWVQCSCGRHFKNIKALLEHRKRGHADL